MSEVELNNVISNTIGASSVGAFSNGTVSVAYLADGFHILSFYDALGTLTLNEKVVKE